MIFKDIWKMCMGNLLRRKGRTFLTVLGVFIGCTSIVVMVSIGIGMKESQDKMLEEMGDLSIIEVSQNMSGDRKESKLTDGTVDSLKAIEGVGAVMPKVSLDDLNVSLRAGINDRYYSPWASLIGVDISVMDDMGFNLIEGKYPSKGIGEALGGEYIAYGFTDSLMPEGHNTIDRWPSYDENGNEESIPEPFFNPLNTDIVLELSTGEENEIPYTKKLRVSGLVKEDYGKGGETSDGLILDLKDFKDFVTAAKKSPAQKINYSKILVKVKDIKLVSDVEKEIKGLGYSTYSMESLRKSMEKSARQIQLMLGGLGAISLFVAAIGITNTMIMSISERTREIGIMKALGCYVKDIRMLFLMEAGTIGLIGGLIALAFSMITSFTINLISCAMSNGGLYAISWQLVKGAIVGGESINRVSVLTPQLMIFAVIFSILIGLISGYYPANKAVKIPALEAIKHE